MSSSTLVPTGGNNDSGSAGSGFCPAPPPPPPPPVLGQVPALKINTVDAGRRPLSNNLMNNNNNNNNNNAYEPPAAIQNAMMTKDKKPFTYTPGMGGKLDLSQIRSPRMARRVAKNANDEGIEGPPKQSGLVTAEAPRPPSLNLYSSQPQVAVPVFPTSVTPSINRIPAVNRVPSNASEKGPGPMAQPSSPQEISTTPPLSSPQVILAKAPTPWLQNKNKPQEELPEWAKRSSLISSSSNSPPESPGPARISVQQIHQVQQPQPPSPPLRQQSHPQERVIPLRIEDRPSVFSVKNEPGHHQLKQQPPSGHHQQRWGNGTQNANSFEQQPQKPQTSGGTYIVPIMVEGSSSNKNNNNNNNNNNNTPGAMYNTQNQSPRVIVQRGPSSSQMSQPTTPEPGPVQSRSFRVLQKITDTDSTDQLDAGQLRKLQLTENDKILMNKVKEQVDGDGIYLHQEEDPRYRGAAIPSRAFRYLQNMTDSGDVASTTNPNATPRGPSGAINKRQNRNSRTFDEFQANLPASEQQAPEPKKYTGSAIPSRSFRILQAMTSPESIGPDQTDY